MMITRNVGMILLSVYLILVGVGLVAGVAIPAILMGLLALGAGIFVLIGR